MKNDTLEILLVITMGIGLFLYLGFLVVVAITVFGGQTG